MPALATGYGHLSMAEFAEGLAAAMAVDWPTVERLTVVVRTPENAAILQQTIADAKLDSAPPT